MNRVSKRGKFFLKNRIKIELEGQIKMEEMYF